MNTVKLYKITRTKCYQMSEQRTGYSLYPWGNNTADYEGYDDDGKDYILPDGFDVAESQFGDLQIYDQDDKYCTIIKKFNSPCLVTSRCEEIILAQTKTKYGKDDFKEMIQDWKADYNLEIDEAEITLYSLTDDGTGNIIINYSETR